MKHDVFRVICEKFVRGDDPDEKAFNKSKVRGAGPWGGTQHGLSADIGTHRLSYDDVYLLSYGTWRIATRLFDKKTGRVSMILINGDAGPSRMTRAQQDCLRRACENIPHAYLPMSALSAARIMSGYIEIIDTTPAREVERQVRRKNFSTKQMETVTVKEHFLGETIFRAHGRVYVSGLDRNDNPAKRNFYLARLPEGTKAKTVDDALKALRPKGLPSNAKRQGEWFFVPCSRACKFKIVYSDHGDSKKGVPIVSSAGAGMQTALDSVSGFWSREDRHVASHMAIDGDNVYVSGDIRDAQHDTLKLGNVWHRVVRNASDGSWGASGDVD